MEFANLAYATEMIFPSFDGEVVARRDYVVFRTSGNPGYYWGNFLLFPEAPGAGAVEAWPALFAREFPHAAHCALAWDVVDNDTGCDAEFVAAGFKRQDELVQLHSGPAPAPTEVEGFVIRRLGGPDERLNIEEDPLDGKADAYASFKAVLRQRYRAMVGAGLGLWFGASPNSEPSRVVAQLGIFRAPQMRARFQSVETAERFRRRGLCKALVSHALAAAFDEFAAQEVVVVADPDYHAAQIYRDLGFVDQYRVLGVYRVPGEVD